MTGRYSQLLALGCLVSCRSARQAINRLAGRYDNPMQELTIHPPLRDQEFGLRSGLVQRNIEKKKAFRESLHLESYLLGVSPNSPNLFAYDT
jgi:hypothetical protein